MLYPRGVVAENSCRNCARANGRFPECVLNPVPGDALETTFFSGACANCLPTSAAKCTLSKLPLRVYSIC